MTLLALGVAVLLWSYLRSGGSLSFDSAPSLSRPIGILLLAACLVEPLFTGERPRPGANLMIVVADNSRSMQLADDKGEPSRGEIAKTRLAASASWLSRLGQDFDVRKYAFDSTLRPMSEGEELKFDGPSSSLADTLRSVGQRFRGQTDRRRNRPHRWRRHRLERSGDFAKRLAADLSGRPRQRERATSTFPSCELAVSQTNFEAAPVTLMAEFASSGLEGKEVVVRVLNDADKEVDKRTIKVAADGQIPAQRFLVKPERPGVTFFSVQVALAGEEKLPVDSTNSQRSHARQQRALRHGRSRRRTLSRSLCRRAA